PTDALCIKLLEGAEQIADQILSDADARAETEAREHGAEESPAAEARRLRPAARLHQRLRMRLQLRLEGLNVLRHLLQQQFRGLAEGGDVHTDLAQIQIQIARAGLVLRLRLYLGGERLQALREPLQLLMELDGLLLRQLIIHRVLRL